jgi:hypothetical protein
MHSCIIAMSMSMPFGMVMVRIISAVSIRPPSHPRAAVPVGCDGVRFRAALTASR